MSHELITEKVLREHINTELSRHPECQDADFQSVIWRLRDVGPFGENWSADTLTYHGRPPDSDCARVFREILEEAARRFTVDWSGDR